MENTQERKPHQRTVNRQKIAYIEQAKVDGMDSIAERFNIPISTLESWAMQHRKGEFFGREHLTTIGYSRRRVSNPYFKPDVASQPTQNARELHRESPPIRAQEVRMNIMSPSPPEIAVLQKEVTRLKKIIANLLE